MRAAAALLILLPLGGGSASANGAMRQSPALMRKAGAACAGGYRGPQRWAGYRYELGGCTPSGR